MRIVDRILATSDLHGQNDRFLNLLEQSKYNSQKDLLIVCGDFIDRGKQNLDCIATCQTLQQKGAIILKGNHEQFLEQSLIEMVTTDTWRTRPSEGLYYWINYNGGYETYHEIKDLSAEKLTKILDFVQQLPLYYTMGKYIFSHAGANTKKPVEANTENELIWMSKEFPWSPAYPGKIMVFGHIPTWRLYGYTTIEERQNAAVWYDNNNNDKICIDCGGVFGGRLAMLALPSGIELYG